MPDWFSFHCFTVYPYQGFYVDSCHKISDTFVILFVIFHSFIRLMSFATDHLKTKDPNYVGWNFELNSPIHMRYTCLTDHDYNWETIEMPANYVVQVHLHRAHQETNLVSLSVRYIYANVQSICIWPTRNNQQMSFNRSQNIELVV